MTAFPQTVRTADRGVVDSAESCADGIHAPGLEEVDNGFEKMAAFYAERARGGVGLIVTGGVSPNHAGRPFDVGATMASAEDVGQHQVVTRAVQDDGRRIILQLLHFGRYAKHADLVAPSAVRAPINRFVPREMDRGRDREDDRRFRSGGGACAIRGLRRRGNHGIRGLSDQRVPRAPHQSPDRRMGWRLRGQVPVRHRDRAPHPPSHWRGLLDLLQDLGGRSGSGRFDICRNDRIGTRTRTERSVNAEHGNGLA